MRSLRGSMDALVEKGLAVVEAGDARHRKPSPPEVKAGNEGAVRTSFSRSRKTKRGEARWLLFLQ
ncbi:hypothetical protein Bca4012_055593 [Brassica carinata]